MVDPPLKERLRGKAVTDPEEILRHASKHFEELAEIVGEGCTPRERVSRLGSKISEIAGDLLFLSESLRSDKGISLGLMRASEEFKRISGYLSNQKS